MHQRSDVDVPHEKRSELVFRGAALSTLRVTTGSLRGRRVPVPRGEVRPTSERARQAFFNIVGTRIEGARFLDLFAGSGIFSFEAMSRGAAQATVIDKSRQNCAAIEQVAKDLGVDIRTVASDAISGIKRLGAAVFDVIYADPPYEFDRYDELLTTLDEHVTLAPDAIVAIEHRRHSTPFSSELKRLRFSRRAEYGEVWISFFIA